MKSRLEDLSYSAFLHLPLMQRLAPAFDSDVGLFRALKLRRDNIFGVNTYSIHVRMNSLASGRPSEAFAWAQGSGISESDACRRALGEAIERTAGAAYRRSEMIFGSYNELISQHNVLNPEELPTFLPAARERLQVVAPTTASKFWWTETTELVSGRSTLIPAFLIYVPYDVDVTNNEAAVDYSTTSGLACGDDFVSAMRSAFFEIIERDAYCLTWLSKRITPNYSGEMQSTLAEWCRTLSAKLIVKDITNDVGVPVISAYLAGNRPGIPRLIAAAGARASLAQTANRAVEELIGCAAFSFFAMEREKPRLRESIVEFMDHARYWIFDGDLKLIDWLQESADRNPFSPCNGRVPISTPAEAVAFFRQLGKRLFVKDLTPPVFRNLGVAVVRCYSPDLQPLYAGDGAIHLQSRRLHEYWEKVLGRSFRLDEINWEPHPFP